MIYLAAFITVTTFIVALWLFGVVPVASKAVDVSRASVKVIRDPALSEEDKERTLQRASLALLWSFLSIIARGGAAIATSMLPMLIFDVTGLASFWIIADFLATWEAIVMGSVLASLLYFLVGRRL